MFIRQNDTRTDWIVDHVPICRVDCTIRPYRLYIFMINIFPFSLVLAGDCGMVHRYTQCQLQHDQGRVPGQNRQGGNTMRS